MSTHDYLNRIHCLDSKDLSLVPDGLCNAAISSWAWESQVNYGDNPENLGSYSGQEFLDRAVLHLQALIPKVRPDGNIMIELQSAIRDGESSLIEEKFAVAAVEQCGLHLVQKLYSIRTNAEPLAPQNRLRRGVVPIFHLVRDPKQYKVYKGAVRKPSTWASRDQRPNKYHPGGKDPGDLIWSHAELLKLPDYQALNAVGSDSNYIAAPKAQNHLELGHPAVMSDSVAEMLVLYATPPAGIVLDNMAGVGTTLLAAKKHGRHFIGYEINPEFATNARHRLGIPETPPTDKEDQAMMQSGITPKILNTKQCSQYIGRSEEAVRMLVKKEKIPFGKTQDGKIVFDKDGIDSWLQTSVTWIVPAGGPEQTQPAQTP